LRGENQKITGKNRKANRDVKKRGHAPVFTQCQLQLKKENKPKRKVSLVKERTGWGGWGKWVEVQRWHPRQFAPGS